MTLANCTCTLLAKQKQKGMQIYSIDMYTFSTKSSHESTLLSLGTQNSFKQKVINLVLQMRYQISAWVSQLWRIQRNEKCRKNTGREKNPAPEVSDKKLRRAGPCTSKYLRTEIQHKEKQSNFPQMIFSRPIQEKIK